MVVRVSPLVFQERSLHTLEEAAAALVVGLVELVAEAIKELVVLPIQAAAVVVVKVVRVMAVQAS